TRQAPSSPFRAVALGPTLPRVLRGDAGAISLTALDRFDVRASTEAAVARQGFESLYEQSVHDLLLGTGRETFEAGRRLQSANAPPLPPYTPAHHPPSPPLH